MSIRRAQKQQRRSNPPPRPTPIAAPTPQSDDGINSTASDASDINAAPSDLPEELIAARAYEKWQLRGCPMGHESEQDWHAARAELEAERLGWAAPQAGDDKRSASK